MGEMPEERKQYLKEYRARNTKRVPLDMNYDDYIKLLQHVAIYADRKSVNGYLKDAAKFMMAIEEAGMKDDVIASLKLRTGMKKVTEEER